MGGGWICCCGGVIFLADVWTEWDLKISLALARSTSEPLSLACLEKVWLGELTIST